MNAVVLLSMINMAEAERVLQATEKKALEMGVQVGIPWSMHVVT